MAGGKWISDVTATTPLAEAARRVLSERLAVVGRFLPLAIHHADDDVEHVHQLRVGTRRARAALDIFSDCLPQAIYQRVRKALRRIRRAAGAARDWDVFRAALLQWRPPNTTQRPALYFLLGYARAEREEAQSHVADLDKIHQHFDPLLRDVTQAVHKSRRPRSKLLIDLAQPMLHELLQRFNVALDGDPRDYEQLHQVRILGKRLRYAMKVFGACFPSPFRDELYPQVESMQEMLGELNDHRVAVGRLETLNRALPESLNDVWNRLKPGVTERLRILRQRMDNLLSAFVEWVDQWRDTRSDCSRFGLAQHPAHAKRQQEGGKS